MAKKDPYKNIQKRFVQARAGDVEFDDISLEDRERFQTRFADLAQTQEGRSKIAQRVLPTATPEQRAQLKQRVRKNLPSSGVGDVEIDMTEEEPKAGPAPQRLLPTSANIRDMQSGFRMQGTAIEKRRASAPPTTTRETTTKSKVSTSDRIGTGFFSVPKNPLSAAKEFVSGITTTGRGIADIGSRGYVNPVINIVARGADVVGGRTGTQKFKPLPQLSNREIAMESALTVGTAGVGAVLRPFLRPTGAALGAIARQIGGRAPGTGAALANISKRQSNLAAVRQASALSEVGARAAAERIAALGSDVGTGTVPKSSGAKFLTPKTTGVTARPVVPKVKSAPKTKATPKAKAVVVQAPKAAPVVAQAAAPKAAVKAAAAPKVASAPATSTSSKFPTTKQIETTANLYAG